MSQSPAKETIYIDTEDEITVIIDKVRSSPAKIATLVLPKRSPTMQSIVNLKLLQKTAKDAKKNVVLVTSDPNLLPIAGAVGMYVAKTPQSKPVIPEPPATGQHDEPSETVEAAAVATGAVAGVAAAKVTQKRSEEGSDASDTVSNNSSSSSNAGAGPEPMPTAEDTIDLDNEVAKSAPVAAATKAKKPKGKKIKVPNFDRFRVLLFAGIAALLLLLVGGYFALFVLPKAKITIKTDTTSVNVDLAVTAQTGATAVDVDKLIVPATSKELKKTDSEKAPATGQRDDGTKATGKMTVFNCTDSDITIPAGTAFSNSGISFGTDAPVSVPASDFFSNGNCKKNSSVDVAVTAMKPGDNANLSSGRDYTSSIGPTLTGKGSTMAGGTTKMTKVVSQQDVDGAKQKATDRMTAAAGDTLKKQFSDAGMTALTDTLSASDPVVTSTPKVGDEATETTVNVAITFTELGVKNDDLKQIVEASAKKQIDSSKQVIQDNGLSKAVIRTTENKTANGVKFQVQSLVVAGPQLDAEGIKKEIAGKKKGQTQQIIQSRPGIKDVNISYSPFWVAATPKKTSHITITFEQADGN